MPPPWATAGGPMAASSTEAEPVQNADAPRPKKKASGYQAWVRSSGQLIRDSAAGTGLKALGAAAGRYWKALSQQERDEHARRAAEASNTADAAEAPATAPQPEPQTRERPQEADALSPAQLAAVAGARARALARRAEAALRQAAPRRATLDDSEAEEAPLG